MKTASAATVDPRRVAPERDARRLAVYVAGLVIVYAVAAILLQPASVPGDAWAFGIMFAPTIGALLARYLGPGVIVWGRPDWWVLAGFLPGVAAIVGLWVASATGVVTVDPDLLTSQLGLWALGIATACLSAVGEEIGWRGFLWPLVRRRLRFIPATLLVTAVWWLYHVPVILVGWYGSMAGLPAFTVAILGFGAFAGVITDRSRGIWPSVLAHGVWNALVATSFRYAFSGPAEFMGEFGWVAAVSMLVLGVVATGWHLAIGGGARSPYPGDTWTAAAQASPAAV